MTRARLKIASRMFEVADNLDRVIEATQETHAKDALFQGVVLLRDQFFRALEEFHVVRIDPKGERFDPKLHEAVSVLAVTSPAQNNQILEVLRPGYMAGGEVLRAAHVVVGRAEPPKP
jgi:molecular chaperone GrpE